MLLTFLYMIKTMCDPFYNPCYDPCYDPCMGNGWADYNPCVPNFNTPCPPFGGGFTPGPVYKTSLGNPSETIKVGPVNITPNAVTWVTVGSSGLCNATTVTGVNTAGLGSNPAAFIMTVNPQLVGTCRPTNITATMVYNINSTSAEKYSVQSVTVNYGEVSKQITFQLATGDVYDPNQTRITVYLVYK